MILEKQTVLCVQTAQHDPGAPGAGYTVYFHAGGVSSPGDSNPCTSTYQLLMKRYPFYVYKTKQTKSCTSFPAYLSC